MKKGSFYIKIKKVYHGFINNTLRKKIRLLFIPLLIIFVIVSANYYYKVSLNKLVKNKVITNKTAKISVSKAPILKEEQPSTLITENVQKTIAEPIKDAKDIMLLVGALKDENINLYSIGYGQEAETGFAQFNLNIKGKSKIFNWLNIKNPLFYPKMFYKDINNDGKKDLIILNTVDSFGDLKQEVHIINVEDLTEIQNKTPVESIVGNLPNYVKQVDGKSLMKLMFPDKNLSEKDGIFTEKTDYSNLDYKILTIEKGSFVNKNSEEYLVVVKETGQSHAGGLENRFVAIINNTKTKLLSSVKEFNADNGEISTFKGKDISYIYFGGTRCYQGYTYSSDVTEIGLWQPAQQWKVIWSKDLDYWEDHVPMVSNEGINIYSRKNFTDNPNETNLYAWELETTLKWDVVSEKFD